MVEQVMKRIEIAYKCKECRGTGIYVGMAERDGAGVLCSKCKGSGRAVLKFEYEDFKTRTRRNDIKRVYEGNPGIVIGAGPDREGNLHNLEEFGGIPYDAWFTGLPFERGSENRRFTCPAWWYQNVDYGNPPDWEECVTSGAFSQCHYFKDKDMCWKRFDKEHSTKQVQ